MVYEAITERKLLIFLLILNLTYIFVSQTNGNLLLVQSFVIFLFLFTIFTRYKVKLGVDLTYEIFVFRFRIYKRTLSSKQITQMKFKRVAWAKKGVVIKVRNGIGIRLFNFYPLTLYRELVQFALTHEIDVVKTKDYEILEK